MSSEGWISVYRSLWNHWLWKDKPFSKGQAWIDLLMLANHADEKRLVRGSVKTFKKGTVNLSMTSLAERWGWHRSTVKKFISLLEKDKMLTTEVTTQGTTLTIENYSIYQAANTGGATTIATAPPTTMRQRCDSTTDINNNDNNDNNDNKNIYIAQIEGEFDALWSKYPNKKGRTNALKAYTKARKEGVGFEEVSAGIDSFNREIKAKGTELRYVKHGSTWFNQRCWNDTYECDVDEEDKGEGTWL